MDASDDSDIRTSDGICRIFCGSQPTRADARRDRLIEAARTLFTERGFHATGVAQIAKESGVLVGQIYRDFANKEEIVAAITAHDLEESLGEADLVQAAEAGDIAAVRGWIRRFVTAKVDKDCRLAAEIMAESMRNPRVAAIFRAIQYRVRGTLARALEAVAPGEARERERALTAEVILTIGGGIFHLGALDGAKVGPDVAKRLIALVDREIDALVAA